MKDANKYIFLLIMILFYFKKDIVIKNAYYGIKSTFLASKVEKKYECNSDKYDNYIVNENFDNTNTIPIQKNTDDKCECDICKKKIHKKKN